MSRYDPHPDRRRRWRWRRRRLLEAGPRAQARARPPSSSSRSSRSEAQLAQTQALIATYEGARRSTRPTTPRSSGSARPFPPTTTRGRWSCSSTPPPSAAASTSTPSTSTGRRRRRHRRRRHRVAPGAVNAGAFSAMPFSLSFTRRRSRTLGSFLSRLERFVSLKGDEIAVSGRLMRVESLALRPGRRTAGRACRSRSAPAPTSCPETAGGRRPRPPRAGTTADPTRPRRRHPDHDRHRERLR